MDLILNSPEIRSKSMHDTVDSRNTNTVEICLYYPKIRISRIHLHAYRLTELNFN